MRRKGRASKGRRSPRRICFVTGTRAEWGLMRPVVDAIRAAPGLRLQIIATGMHLDRSRGRSVDLIRRQGFKVDATVPWKARRDGDLFGLAGRTGEALAGIAAALRRLKSDVVLVVGDRVEAFAAAAAGQIAGVAVAHVHGGDRALGQVDDTLRHAITKLSHLHFPATAGAARRLRRLGEAARWITCAGSPAVDGIGAGAARWSAVRAAFPKLVRRRYALLVLHPTDADARREAARARMLIGQTLATGFERVVAVYPNNDPGSAGIAQELRRARDGRLIVRRDLDRGVYLALLRDAAVLVGNSSSGIIEAGSFGTPVLDVGPRQLGRERGGNVVHVEFEARAIAGALARLWDKGRAPRRRSASVYGHGGAGERIAAVLGRVRLDEGLRRKLIAY